MAKTIPQRELRNNVSEILRRVEAGERFTVTVGGRPVAELGPTPPMRAVRADDVRVLLRSTPVDPDWLDELLSDRQGLEDPFPTA